MRFCNAGGFELSSETMTHILAQDLEQCALRGALEALGERWSFLILRGALTGLRQFEEFQSTLGIARNILANRIARLVDTGIMVRQPRHSNRRQGEKLKTHKARPKEGGVGRTGDRTC